MSDDAFWRLIEDERKISRKHPFDSLASALARLGSETTKAFAKTLAHKLFLLDHPMNANQDKQVVTLNAADASLDLRCWAIGQGPATFDHLLQNPGSFAWSDEMRNGYLLVEVPSEAWQTMTGRAAVFVTTESFSTGSNTQYWGNSKVNAQMADTVAPTIDPDRWYSDNPPERIRLLFGSEDIIWDHAAAYSSRFFTARLIASNPDEVEEFIVLTFASPLSSLDEVSQKIAIEFAQSLARQVLAIELFDTHVSRPVFGGMAEIFSIERKTSLPRDEYVQKFVRPVLG
jgi:hypothetical protein